MILIKVIWVLYLVHNYLLSIRLNNQINTALCQGHMVHDSFLDMIDYTWYHSVREGNLNKENMSKQSHYYILLHRLYHIPVIKLSYPNWRGWDIFKFHSYSMFVSVFVIIKKMNVVLLIAFAGAIVLDGNYLHHVPLFVFIHKEQNVWLFKWKKGYHNEFITINQTKYNIFYYQFTIRKFFWIYQMRSKWNW